VSTTTDPGLAARWQAAWPEALARWSPYTQLRPPTYYESDAATGDSGMAGQIAAIRLEDQAVMVNLETIRRLGLDDHALAVLADEIGHHVYVPGNLADNARMLAAVKPVLFGLPNDTAHLVANLYGDLLLNDRLQRRADVDVAAVYRRLREAGPADDSTQTWRVYTRTYEHLWRLAPGTLAPPGVTDEMNADAALIARLVRHYAARWLGGARRFACILYPYLQADEEQKKAQTFTCLGLGDLRCAGRAAVPDGLTGIDPAELGEDEEFDRALAGLEGDEDSLFGAEGDRGGKGRSRGAQKRPIRRDTPRRFRDPAEYGELLRALGLNLTDQEITARYYRERALPHLVPFPERKTPQAKEPLAEGYETWEPADDLEELDLFGSLVRSPEMVPGVTTVRRVYGETPGSDPARLPVDLYLGVDCSGSMVNPNYSLSYPVLAGTILALSALRVGARVMTVLSGEPGSSVATDGFVSDERQVLNVLTSYLGTGYTFGVQRLRDAFGDRKSSDREAHIVIVTDHDIFAMLDAGTGWECAREAVAKARGGGTYVLNMPVDREPDGVARMRADGWKVHAVQNWEEVVDFARAFVRDNYEEARGASAPGNLSHRIAHPGSIVAPANPAPLPLRGPSDEPRPPHA
jgi:hypothetical protein